MEETATADQHETLEVELRANFDFGNDLKSAWWGVPETEVVAGLPNEELTQVQEVNKDTGDNQQVISAETKKSVTDKKHRGHWGKNEQEGLEPGNCVLGERAVEEEVLKGFDGGATEAGERDRQTEGDQALCGAEDTMRYLPGKVEDMAI